MTPRTLQVALTGMLLWLGAGGAVADTSSTTNRAVDFQRDIRPLLSANCFQCHGPDEGTREAELRLDQPGNAYEDRGGYAAIVPGNPLESELFQRISTQDPDAKMPPESSNKTLTEDQILLIEQWIESGAKYTQHWSFVSPQRSPLPRVRDLSWVNNEIDGFVLDKLEQEGLSPSPEADRNQLIRRVYLDLIGIPPTVQEVDAFVADEEPDAYEKVVDRLLASPHYGEKWARRWLDLARYSDTNGYEKDQPRSMWPYRDWVIQALNNDMPFDQFTIEQIAGDLLPNATLDQRIATGFHRNTMINEEGGIDPQEFRFLAIVDRVATTGATWLGLTLGCAQCHTHKFDPITHAEYYQLFALLNNANEVTISLPDPSIDVKRDSIERAIEEIIASYPSNYPVEENSVSDANGNSASLQEIRDKTLEKDFSIWKDEQRRQVANWVPLRPLEVVSNLASTEVLRDGSVLCSGDFTKNDTFDLTFAPPDVPITAIRLEALPDPSLPNGGPGRQQIAGDDGSGGGNFFLSEIQAWRLDNYDSTVEKITPLLWKSASASYVPEGLEANHAIDGRHDTGWTIHGRSNERHTAVFRLADSVTLSEKQFLKLRLEHENFYPAGLGRFRISVTADKGPFVATGFTDEVIALLQMPEDTLSDSDQEVLRKVFLNTTPLLKSEHERIRQLRNSKPRYPTTLVMQERSEQHQRKTFRHHRGEYLQAKESITPGVPEILHNLPEGSKKDRLAFARWLVDRQNPLVARVMVNRQWEAIFGQGIVRTTEDFGYQGSFPTHPELLDWLAVEFMESGWSLKKLHRLLVTSATYRQSSNASPEAVERDPENNLLTRGPRTRLDAELVRDSILSISGLLSRKIGGASVFPPQPAGITEAAYGPLQWVTSVGEDRYRRGLYTFNKRTAPYAAFGLFDAPSGEVCLTRRDRSNTPLQSLAMLNDVVTMEAARHMATEAMNGHDSPGDIAFNLFRRCVQRPPSEDELSRVLSFYERQQRRFTCGEVDLHRVLNTGPVHTWQFSVGNNDWLARNQCTVNVENKHLVVTSSGEDPFFGASLESPAGSHTLSIVASFATSGKVEVYWTTKESPEESTMQSQSLEIIPNQWHEYVFPLETNGQLTTLRIDPGQSPGTTLIKRIHLAYGDGLYVLTPDLDENQLAAWLVTARALLNLNETIWKP